MGEAPPPISNASGGDKGYHGVTKNDSEKGRTGTARPFSHNQKGIPFLNAGWNYGPVSMLFRISSASFSFCRSFFNSSAE